MEGFREGFLQREAQKDERSGERGRGGWGWGRNVGEETRDGERRNKRWRKAVTGMEAKNNR